MTIALYVLAAWAASCLLIWLDRTYASSSSGLRDARELRRMQWRWGRHWRQVSVPDEALAAERRRNLLMLCVGGGVLLSYWLFRHFRPR